MLSHSPIKDCAKADDNRNDTSKYRHVYIMPDINVNEGDFIWLYTREGRYHTYNNNSKTITHNIYWGLDIHSHIMPV